MINSSHRRSGVLSLKADLSSDNIRAFIANQLGINVQRVTDRSHIMQDLGADWLERLDLVIFIEEAAGIELDDDDVDQIAVVGDLIRCVLDAVDKRPLRAA
jgi:acyl carrier protein